jgi:hypothetical protein
MGPYKFKKPRHVELSANVADWAPAMHAAGLLRPDEQTLFGGFGTSASGHFRTNCIAANRVLADVGFLHGTAQAFR